jgi:hypothetical protein
MRSLLLLLLLLSLALAACAHSSWKHDSGVEPRLRVHSTNPADYRSVSLHELKVAAIGVPLRVAGDLSAMCSRDATKWGDKNDKTEYAPCHQQPIDLIVRCAGPCTVDGQIVTPTAAGTIAIAVEMISQQTKQRYQRSATVPVVPPGGFVIRDDQALYSAPCAGPIRAEGETLRCAVSARYEVKLDIVDAFGDTIGGPVRVNGEDWKTAQFQLEPYLRQRNGVPPANDPSLGNTVEVEFARHGFRRVVVFEMPQRH